jgi:tetratricopeptide (TPR) repeat protein
MNRGFLLEAKEYLEKSAVSATIESARMTSILNLARNYTLLGEPQRGLEILRDNKACLWKSKPIGYCRTLAFIYMKIGKVEKARSILKLALQIHPQNTIVKALLGWLYLENPPDKGKAKEYFQTTIRDRPDSVLAHLGLGRIYEEEDLERAIKEYKKVIELAPGESKAYYRLGLIYSKKLLAKKAEWYFKKTIQLSPNFAPVYNDLATLYASMNPPNWELAKEYVEKAKELGYPIEEDFLKLIQENLSK